MLSTEAINTDHTRTYNEETFSTPYDRFKVLMRETQQSKPRGATVRGEKRNGSCWCLQASAVTTLSSASAVSGHWLSGLPWEK